MSSDIVPHKIISQAQFAKQIKVSKQRVHQFIQENRLTTIDISGRRYILLDEKSKLIIEERI